MISEQRHDDFAFEPIPGLPERPPADEKILWQGMPDPWAFAIDVMWLRIVAAAVAVLVAWRAISGIHDGISAGAVLVAAGGTLAGGLVVIALLGAAGWLMARETIYTITTQRLVIRHGVAMPMAINVPFAKVTAAAVSETVGGKGQAATHIALGMMPASRMSLIALWPHARPGYLRQPEPMLRAISDGDRVAAILGQALKQATATTAAPSSTSALPAPDSVSDGRRLALKPTSNVLGATTAEAL